MMPWGLLVRRIPNYNPELRTYILKLGKIISLTNKMMGYEFKSPKEYVKTHPGTRMEYVDTFLKDRILPLINSFYEDNIKQTLENYKGPAAYIDYLREYTKLICQYRRILTESQWQKTSGAFMKI